MSDDLAERWVCGEIDDDTYFQQARQAARQRVRRAETERRRVRWYKVLEYINTAGVSALRKPPK